MIVIYLRDLILIEEGNPDFIEGGLINWAKRGKISEVLNEIRLYQQKGYNLQKVGAICSFIEERHAPPDTQQMILSHLIEPDKHAD